MRTACLACGRGGAGDLIDHRHAADVLEHEHEPMTLGFEVAVKQSWGRNGETRRQGTVEIVLAPIQCKAFAHPPVLGGRARQLHDDARGGSLVGFVVVEVAAHHLAHYAGACTDLFNAGTAGQRETSATGGQRIPDPFDVDCMAVSGDLRIGCHGSVRSRRLVVVSTSPCKFSFTSARRCR